MRVTSNIIGKTLVSGRNASRLGRLAIEVGALIVLLIAGTAGMRLARGWPPAYAADLTILDPPSAGFDLAGVYIPEHNGDFYYSWSSGYTLTQLRGGYNAAPSYRASVRLRAANPAGPQPLTFLRNEQPLATVMPSTEFRIYRVLL